MKFQLHVSGLMMLSHCGEQFRRRYIEGEKRPPGAALLVGTAVHRSVEYSLSARLGDATASLPPVEEIKDMAATALGEEWGRNGVDLQPGEDPARARGEAADKAVRLAALHLLDVAPGIKPTALEEKWVLELDGYDFQLAGQIDIIDAAAGVQVLRDTKTAGKRPVPTVADTSIQLTCYSMARRYTTGVLPDTVALDYLIDKREPAAETFASTRDESDFPPFLDRVAEAIRAVERGVFIPAAPDHWGCRKKWCGYYDSCRYVRRPVSAPVVREIAPAKPKDAAPARPAPKRGSLDDVFDSPGSTTVERARPALQPPPKLALW